MPVHRAPDWQRKYVRHLIDIFRAPQLSQLAGFLRSMKDEGMDANSRFPKVRIFDMKYRGSPSPAPCISHLDYYTSAVESRCRAWLVENGKVKKMWCEDQLAEREPVQKDISDACISKGGKLVRQTLADSLDDDEASAVSIMALMKKKRSWMDSNDRFSKIERGFWEAVTGTMAQSRLEGKVIGCFPTPPLRKKDSEILANFESINTSQLLYFCGASSKSWWTTVYGYVKAICAGAAPGLEKAKESDFMTKFQECLKNQCEFEEAAGSDGAAGTLYGQAAIAKHYEAVKAKMQDAEAKLVYKDIKEVIKFGWALAPSERQSAAKALTLAGPKGKNADEKDAKAKSPAVKKAADDKKALVRSLFMKRSPP
ncbi:unnamed protein product [Prorocentrum cordatum]|uniref:Uncharacterized protein n=1 Tax=Prorocentrum cordatum TaxID=2364126 RepID=A0ABN9S965_9DINO|nr:unnamed protein product [Polarella glacialis]